MKIVAYIFYLLAFTTATLGYVPNGIYVVTLVSGVLVGAILVQPMAGVRVGGFNRLLGFLPGVPLAMALVGLVQLGHIVDDYAYVNNMVRLIGLPIMIWSIFVIAARYGSWSDAVLRNGVIAYGIALPIHVIWGVMTYAGEIGPKMRISGLYENANHFGVACVIGVLLMASFHWGMTAGRVRRCLVVIISSSGFIGILLSGSRQAILGVSLGLVVLGIVHMARASNWSAYVRIVLLVVALCGAAMYWNSKTGHLERLESAILAGTGSDNVEYDGSLVTRSELFEAGFRMFADYPVLGVGINQFRVHARSYGASKDVYAHSNYVEVIATTGIVGSMIYFSMYVVLILAVWVTRRLRVRCECKRRRWGFALSYMVVLLFFDVARVSYIGPLEWFGLSITASCLVVRKCVHQPLVVQS